MRLVTGFQPRSAPIEPGRRAWRQRALRELRHAAAQAQDGAAAAHIAPLQLADRPFEIEIELRREVMLDQGRDRPRGRRRPLVGYRVEEGVLHEHRLAVAVDLAVLAPHSSDRPEYQVALLV